MSGFLGGKEPPICVCVENALCDELVIYLVLVAVAYRLDIHWTIVVPRGQYYL